MRYRELPIEVRLRNVRDTQGADEMVKTRSELFLQVANMEGFQIVTVILRDRERMLHNQLMLARDPNQICAVVGGLKEIEQIRASLAALVPAEQRSAIDWFDDAEEDYISPLDKGRK